MDLRQERKMTHIRHKVNVTGLQHRRGLLLFILRERQTFTSGPTARRPLREDHVETARSARNLRSRKANQGERKVSGNAASSQGDGREVILSERALATGDGNALRPATANATAT